MGATLHRPAGRSRVHLSEPFTRQLDGKLRELRFYLDRQPTRISYFIATGRVIVLLTVFTKTRPRERAEIDRARRAEKGLSQRQLAERVGTTQAAIARLEGGRISPSLPTLDRIANALDAELTVSLTDSQQLLGAR